MTKIEEILTKACKMLLNMENLHPHAIQIIKKAFLKCQDIYEEEKKEASDKERKKEDRRELRESAERTSGVSAGNNGFAIPKGSIKFLGSDDIYRLIAINEELETIDAQIINATGKKSPAAGTIIHNVPKFQIEKIYE